jgi:hypothetical protein
VFILKIVTVCALAAVALTGLETRHYNSVLIRNVLPFPHAPAQKERGAG